MKQTIEIQVDENHKILAEVETHSPKADSVASSSPSYYSRTRELSESVEVIRPLVEKIISPLMTLEKKPSKVDLEFGFRFGGDAQVVLTQNQAESLVKVRLSFEG